MQTEQFAVLGAGLMGVGIATHFARFGHDIWLYDTEQSRIAEIHVVAGGILDELISCEQFTAPEKENVLKRLHGTTSLADIADSQLLIEAIPERLELKHALYTELETLISPEAIVASNTSGLPPDDLKRENALPATTADRPFLASAALHSTCGDYPRQRYRAKAFALAATLACVTATGSSVAGSRCARICRQPSAICTVA